MTQPKQGEIVQLAPFLNEPNPALVPQPQPQFFDSGVLAGVVVGFVFAEFLRWTLWRSFDDFFG